MTEQEAKEKPMKMSDYKTKCLSILEGVDFGKSMWDFPLIQSVHGNVVDGWELTDLGGKTIQCNPWMSVSDAVLAYALLSHRVPQPDENGLMPCPHCGGKAEYWTKDHFFHFVNCRKCPAETSCQSRKEDAIKAWNRRANQGGKNEH